MSNSRSVASVPLGIFSVSVSRMSSIALSLPFSMVSVPSKAWRVSVSSWLNCILTVTMTSSSPPFMVTTAQLAGRQGMQLLPMDVNALHSRYFGSSPHFQVYVAVQAIIHPSSLSSSRVYRMVIKLVSCGRRSKTMGVSARQLKPSISGTLSVKSRALISPRLVSVTCTSTYSPTATSPIFTRPGAEMVTCGAGTANSSVASVTIS